MQSTRALRALPVVFRAFPVAACFAATLSAQGSYRVTRDGEWFYSAPAGKRLARLANGAVVEGGAVQGDWIQVTLLGWIFGTSVGPTTRDSFTLAVIKDPQENLRAQPAGNGALVAQLTSGFGLTQIGEQQVGKARWVQVRRQGWARKAAVAAVMQVASSTSGPASAAAALPPAVPPADSTSRKTNQNPLPLPPPAAVPPPDPSRLRPERPTAIYRAPPPEGTPAGTLDTTATVRVLSRSGGGDWVRVQVEGWVRAADLEQAPAGVQVGVSAAELRADPARYAGAVLRWPLQAIAVQTADDLRPDIPNGTPYLLARGPLPEHGFVYVMFTEAQRAAVQALGPLATVQATVKVRAAHSKFIATPIVELVSLEVQP